MRTGRKPLGQRLLAMLMCICLLVAYLPQIPAVVKAADITVADIQGKTVDPHTINGWKDYFLANNVSTEYAGGVWTDKSVFASFADYQAAVGVTDFLNPANNPVGNDIKQMLATDPENFLVAMSAISANKTISGSASTPTDTVLVIDVSGSMQGANAVAVVQAANQAIDTLLKQNTNNRVGVILYSGNSQQGSSGTNTASVMLSMGRYTTTNTMTINQNGREVRIPAYLTVSGSGENQYVYVASSVNNGNNADSKNVIGGTYIQNGLYKAWEQFNAVTDTKVPAGQPQAGAQRLPVLVLLSDGAPTAATVTYDSVGLSNNGDGTYTNERIGFMTQLTASWVRNKIGTKYGTVPKFYTLGVGTGSDAIATSVLNPAASSDTLNDYWYNYFNNPEDSYGYVEITPYIPGQEGMWIYIPYGEPGYPGYWQEEIEEVPGLYLYTDSAVQTQNYVDQYWLSNDADGLLSAFEQIVNTIVLESERYTTLVGEKGEDLSGYITFEDELGEMIEVKDLKGLVVGNRIFTGAEMAKSFTTGQMGTIDSPSAYGDELIRTVKERLGITETSVAQQLVGYAYNAGQLHYTSATEYSNYIGWYADDAGNYKGFWQESDGYDAANAPEGATYINKSYGYLGAEVGNEGASDMMHVVVMVHTKISTGRQSVVYKIPASLIPTVTYNVELEGEDPASPKSVTRDDASPMQLIFEVGLRSGINEINLEAKVAEHIEKGGHIHKNADGTYTFYTNRWGDGDGGEVNYDEPLSHYVAESHFFPALTNDRYYHTENDRIYTNTSGTAYTGNRAPSGTGYYYARHYYQVSNGSVRYMTKYVPLAAASVARAQRDGNNWYVPAGTPVQDVERFQQPKTVNNTGTLEYANYPVVLHNESGYNVYAFMGNNGSFTLTPAQGIALTKTVAEAVEGAPTEFTFTVRLSQPVADPAITDADGNPLANIATVSGNTITVKVQSGQTVYITGIPTGTTYTVEEAASTYYTAHSTNASGTVSAYTINPVDFENLPRIFNDLIISKDVLPPQWMTDVSALEAQAFSLQVTITGADPNTTYTTSGSVTFVTDAQGTATQNVELKNNQSITVYDLPAGAAYSVSEVPVPDGYISNAPDTAPITGVIPETGMAVAGVTNTYEPDSAQVTVSLTGTKTFLTSGGYTVPDGDWPTAGFTVELYRIDEATGQETLVRGNIPVTPAAKTWSVDVALTFDQVGSYLYRIVEKDGGQADIVYDGTNGLFRVNVVDDGSGTLQVSQVLPVQDTVTVTENDGRYAVDKDFTNYKDAGSVSIPVQKIITGSTGISVNDFIFGLYDASGNLLDTIVGNGSFVIAGYGADFTTPRNYTVREIIPALENRVVGVTYDTTVYDVSVQWLENNGAHGLVATVAGTENNVAVFTNTYDHQISTPAIQLAGDKTMTGDRTAFQTGERYTMELYQTNASFNTATGRLVQTDVVGGSDYSYAFEGLAFEAEGTYYFVVKEAVGTQGGVTYDTARYHVTITVTRASEQGSSKTVLVADANVVKYGTNEQMAQDALDFTNVYTVTGSAQTTIAGVKRLTGRELIAGEFRFGLYEGTQELQTVTNTTGGRFTFDTIVYTPADIGTHTYTVKEISNGLGGVTYDTDAYTVVVTVADNGEGGLTLTRTVNGGNAPIEFVNTYRASPTGLTLNGVKKLYNTDTGMYETLTGGEYTFDLYASVENFSIQGQRMASVSNGADGAIAVSLNYTEAGNYYYILRERIGSDPTLSYDTARYFIRVLVSDDGLGQLHVSYSMVKEGVGTANAIEFGNIYTPIPAQAQIEGTKVLTGRDIVDGEFTFELYDENGEKIQSVTNRGNNFAFETITYTNSGTYTYTVKENIPAYTYKGVTYDISELPVTVTVQDVDGRLTATVDYPEGITFNNSYAGADTYFSVQGQKELSGNKTLTEGMFTFELYDKYDVHLATATNQADGTFQFLHIPLPDEGDYTFYVIEKQPAGAVDNRYNGITYSTDRYDIAVSVTDPGAGQLEAADPVITKNGQPAQMVFTNTYTVETTSVRLRAIKHLSGRDLISGEFRFQLHENGVLLQETGNGPTGMVVFDTITYEEAGEHIYTISEVNSGKGGVTYDTTTYRIRVEVIDNGDGTLSAGVTHLDGFPTFENTYAVTGNTAFSVEGTKVLTGRTMTGSDVFTFALWDSDGELVQTAQNNGTAFAFENVTLDQVGTHTFTVTEQSPAGGVKDGITYSTESYTVTVTVRDNGVGGMEAGVPVITVNGRDIAQMTFHNSYAVTEGTHVDIQGKKTLSNKDLEAGMFTFELYDADGALLDTVTNGSDGSILFENVAIDALGTTTFTVKEVAPEGNKKDGITYSTLVYTVTVETTDNGLGGMTAAQPVYALGAVVQPEMEFINTYAVEGQTAVTITANKVLTGGKKLTDNMFAFELYQGEEPTGTPIAVAQNQADGTVTFADVPLTALGITTFTVKEVTPEGFQADGIRYSGVYYNVDVEVLDNGVGGMETGTVVYRLGTEVVDSATFTNIYTPEAVHVDLSIQKTVKVNSGEGVGPENFQFQIADGSGKVLATVTSDKQGKALYTATYDQDDIGQSYRYVVTEVNTQVNGVTYSTVKYTVDVAVTQNDLGLIIPVVKLDGKDVQTVELTFVNTYDKAETPETGDSFQMIFYMVMMTAGLIGMVTTVVIKKKEETAE